MLRKFRFLNEVFIYISQIVLKILIERTSFRLFFNVFFIVNNNKCQVLKFQEKKLKEVATKLLLIHAEHADRL